MLPVGPPTNVNRALLVGGLDEGVADRTACDRWIVRVRGVDDF